MTLPSSASCLTFICRRVGVAAKQRVEREKFNGGACFHVDHLGVILHFRYALEKPGGDDRINRRAAAAQHTLY